MHSLAKHPLVDCDLEEAALWYGRRDAKLAETLIAAAEVAMRTAAADPLRFSLRFGECRRVRLAGFPYAVIFTVQAQTVYVLAIAHLARDLSAVVEGRHR